MSTWIRQVFGDTVNRDHDDQTENLSVSDCGEVVGRNPDQSHLFTSRLHVAPVTPALGLNARNLHGTVES